MTFFIDYAHKDLLDIDYEKIVKELSFLSLKEENVPYECELSISFVDDEEIRKINKEFRNLDKSTDVLSFPMNFFETPATFDEYFEENASFNLESKELILGDIVISVDTLLKQAKEYGHSKERELAFLIVHSILHLLGYDHMNEEEEKVMFKKQEEILKLGGYHR